MIKKLASLNLTLAALAGMLVCLLAGYIMGFTPMFRPVMGSLNDGLISQWLADNWAGHPVVALWFITLVLSATLMFINLLACLADRLLPWIKSGPTLRRWLLLASHLLIVVIMLGHAGSFVLGFKDDRIKLSGGQEAALPDGYSLRVDEILFVDNPAVLKLDHKKSKAWLTREKFHRHQNGAKVSLLHGNDVVMAGAVYMLKPLTKGQLTVAITGMFYDDRDGRDTPGGVFAVVKTPLNEVFFAAYALMISCMLGLLAVGWRGNGGD